MGNKLHRYFLIINIDLTFLDIALLVGIVRFANGSRGRLNSSGFLTLQIKTSRIEVNEVAKIPTSSIELRTSICS